jgi:hypothetical protein
VISPMSDQTPTWADLLREVDKQTREGRAKRFANDHIFLGELRRELERERAAWTPRQRFVYMVRRRRRWLEENVTWRFARERPDNDW